MCEFARRARGPNLAPGRFVVDPSQGAPTTATSGCQASNCSASVTSGSRPNVAMPWYASAASWARSPSGTKFRSDIFTSLAVVARVPRTACSLCRLEHLRDDRGNVVVGRPVIHDASTQSKCASDVPIRQVDAPATDQVLQDGRIATIESGLVAAAVVPSETHSAQFDGR